jgi:hypothetical protein
MPQPAPPAQANLPAAVTMMVPTGTSITMPVTIMTTTIPVTMTVPMAVPMTVPVSVSVSVSVSVHRCPYSSAT